MAAVILLSKVSVYNLAPINVFRGSILCNISFLGLADLYLNHNNIRITRIAYLLLLGLTHSVLYSEVQHFTSIKVVVRLAYGGMNFPHQCKFTMHTPITNI